MTDLYEDWDVRTGYGMVEEEHARTVAELRALIQSELDNPQTSEADLPGLRKALLIAEELVPA